MGKGTAPGMESVESSLEQRPRTMHDYMNIGVRVMQEARTEEPLSRALSGTNAEVEQGRGNCQGSRNRGAIAVSEPRSAE